MPPTLAISTVLVVTFLATALGHPVEVPRPIQGHQQGIPSNGWDIIFPLSIVQCESVLIYYNNTLDVDVYSALASPENIYDISSQRLLILSFPKGVGYLDWVCNIPAAHTFIVFPIAGSSGGFNEFYTVQRGSSSACLGDVTTTYSYVTYSTANFQSYTHSFANFSSSPNELGTVTFPTNALPTITANPDMAVTSATSIFAAASHTSPVSPSSTGSSSTTGSSSSTGSRKFNRAAIAGGAAGGSVVILALLFIFAKRWKRSCTEAVMPPPERPSSATGSTNRSEMVGNSASSVITVLLYQETRTPSPS